MNKDARSTREQVNSDPQGAGMMDEVFFCPFYNGECKKELCMLYEKSEITHVGRGGNCALYNISRELKSLISAMEQPHKFK